MGAGQLWTVSSHHVTREHGIDDMHDVHCMLHAHCSPSWFPLWCGVMRCGVCVCVCSELSGANPCVTCSLEGGTIANGALSPACSGGLLADGSQCSVVCNQNFNRSGDPFVCRGAVLTGGQTCMPACTMRALPTGVEMGSCGATLPVGSQCELQPTRGYRLIGIGTLTCAAGGLLSNLPQAELGQASKEQGRRGGDGERVAEMETITSTLFLTASAYVCVST
jgi:hypothetical protein